MSTGKREARSRERIQQHRECDEGGAREADQMHAEINVNERRMSGESKGLVCDIGSEY